MTTPRVGLLPLSLALYDQALPEMRPRLEAFAAAVAGALGGRGVEVRTAPVCRLRQEVATAVRTFEGAGVDALVTLHLAYSPSLEAVGPLAASSLPLIVLDTTPAYDFGPAQEPAAILFNHGIHGVQDLCNLLIRHGKPFQIEVGHWERSDVLDRVALWAQAARLVSSLRSARVGRIGEPFAGMGDFAIPPDLLRATLGVTTIESTPEALRSYLPAPDDPQVTDETAADAECFETRGVSDEAHRESGRAGLALRRWIAEERLTAFTVNFLACTRASGLPTMPFLEISKAMARGIGYAGEGDALTAAFGGALAAGFPQTTFTEMFCPDWAGGRIFLSHMGEVNCDLLAGTPILIEKPFAWTDARDPVCAVGCLRPGEAVLANLAPGPDGRYTLILAPGEMVEGGPEDQMRATVHGWLRPRLPLERFLAEYSRLGGTHHSALVYGAETGVLARFGALMGWQVAVLGEAA